MSSDLGTLTQHGDDVTVTFVRRLPHPVAKVWRAVTEPEHLRAWFPDTIELTEWKPGAPLNFVMKTGDSFDGEVVTFEPERRLELRWGTDMLRIDLEPDGDDATVLTFIDTFHELGKAVRDSAGWHECLAHLAAHLDGASEPTPGDLWDVVRPKYVDRFGPEAATIGPPPGYETS